MFKIFAGNVNFRTTEQKLRALFDPLLEIEDVVIARDPKTGRSLGYGFIMTRDAEQGRAAMRRLGKQYIDGRLVYFREATGRKPAKRRRSRPPRGDGRQRRSSPGGRRAASANVRSTRKMVIATRTRRPKPKPNGSCFAKATPACPRRSTAPA